jgi:hypothetical protein
MKRCLVAIAAALVLGVAAPVASAYVYAPTARAAALAATKKDAEADIRAWGGPATYKVGTCRVLHRKPWLAYGCEYRVHGIPTQCLNLVTVAVKRLTVGRYRAAVVKWHDLRDQPPC